MAKPPSRREQVSLRISVLAAVLMLSLASVGIGYGLWSRTLSISGIVETGRVDAKWILANCSEFHPWPGGGIQGEFEGKDVGETTATIDPQDDQILHIKIDNAYPSYAVDCEVHFVNDGSIPVFIRGTVILPVTGNLSNCSVTGNQTKTLKCDQLTVIYVDGIGAQVDPGDGMASSLVVHVEQPAGQNATYEFDVIECMAQWNEPATAEACMAAAP